MCVILCVCFKPHAETMLKILALRAISGTNKPVTSGNGIIFFLFQYIKNVNKLYFRLDTSLLKNAMSAANPII